MDDPEFVKYCVHKSVLVNAQIIYIYLVSGLVLCVSLGICGSEQFFLLFCDMCVCVRACMRLCVCVCVCV